MAEHPNIELVRTGYAMFEKGDIEAFLDLLTDDVVFHIPGRNSLSGEYKGKQGAVEFFTKVGTLFPDTTLEVLDVLANDTRTVAIVEITATKGDRTHTGQYIHSTLVRDGKVCEFREFPDDQYAEDDFYSA